MWSPTIHLVDCPKPSFRRKFYQIPSFLQQKTSEKLCFLGTQKEDREIKTGDRSRCKMVNYCMYCLFQLWGGQGLWRTYFQTVVRTFNSRTQNHDIHPTPVWTRVGRMSWFWVHE